ncbi:MAG: 6-pyruvoyl trahydropterin synthase family protein [Candidatus Hodarchaeales archaeon]|jgi:6-pyruvoyltetrahydropterin/6-carboxytetrahydropterin synthase
MTLEQEFSRIYNYFSASHFLIGFDKCDRLHGHNYRVKLRVRYKPGITDEISDFRIINSILKNVLKGLDHKILLAGNSSETEILSSKTELNWEVYLKDKMYSFPKKDVLILEDLSQTTAENLAIYIHKSLNREIGKGIKGLNIQNLTVIVGETEGNEAIYKSKIS